MRSSNSAERLKELMRAYNMKQSDVVEKTGIPKSAISMYLSGDRVPKQNRLSLIADTFNVSETWLMGYDVPMKRTLTPEMDSYKSEMTQFSEKWNLQYFEKEMLKSFSQLSDTNKKQAINYTQNLLNIQKMEEEQSRLIPIAAHKRTDITDDDITNEREQHDMDIMNNDDFWK